MGREGIQRMQGVESLAAVPQNLKRFPRGKTSYGDALRYCPLCSQRLESRRCKLVCNVCGYYMFCADYY
jgi:hypothetical protein